MPQLPVHCAQSRILSFGSVSRNRTGRRLAPEVVAVLVRSSAALVGLSVVSIKRRHDPSNRGPQPPPPTA